MANAELLEKELSAYFGQDIRKLVFNAAQLLYISSSGIRTIVYAKKKLISQSARALCREGKKDLCS